jgi:2-oxoglutarate dehydrogenase E1 component
MVCYRKHGHNEGDDPKFTQPNLYEKISDHPNPREIYTKQLIESGAIESEMAKKLDKSFWDDLQNKLNTVRKNDNDYSPPDAQAEPAWKEFRKSKPKDFVESPKTAISQKTVDKVVEGLIHVPENFNPLSKVERMLKKRREKYFDAGKLDWASAELLAYGSLLLEGKNIRFSGQDSIRGTFSHRHAILYDSETNEGYERLNNIAEDQGHFRIYNSPLSEFGVLGFEYGYSIAAPDVLTIWEAQFGDFANGAQTVIDQFITSSESKWRQMSGLVLLLPHGYEGQGPEHSSARLERFLQASAEFNITVCNCTTPANFFHLLRRQLAWPFRKPLVHMSPKSLLRHPKCVSKEADIKKGGFQEVIDDKYAGKKPKKVKRVLLCSGKIYYDLLEKQQEDKRKDVAIVRLEQLYPLPYHQLDAIVDKYKNAEFKGVQEEPANMGAWTYMLSCYRKVDLQVISRKASASPATGYKKIHKDTQQAIIDEAFTLNNNVSKSERTAKKRQEAKT